MQNSYRRSIPVLGVALLIAASQTPATRTQTGVRPSPPQAVFHPDKLVEMDAAVNQAVADHQCPGVVLWLERNGVAYHKAYGKRALAPAEEPMTEDTLFDAASLTKVVACTPAVMLLVERGQLDLEQRVQTYLPEFKGDGKETITLRQLLTHTSGLRPDISTQPAWSGNETAIRMACAEKPTNPPGTAFRYSDINFFLLGEVVRRVSGLKLDEFVEREVYRPLKMLDTGFRPISTTNLASVAATDSGFKGPATPPPPDTGAKTPAAANISPISRSSFQPTCSSPSWACHARWRRSSSSGITRSGARTMSPCAPTARARSCTTLKTLWQSNGASHAPALCKGCSRLRSKGVR